MLPIVLALALLTADPEIPADLAAKVASTDPAIREQAEGALEELGRPALPVLRIAVAKANNPIHVRRLVDLIDLIERKRLLHATSVELVERGVSVSDAVADLSRRSRFRLDFDPLGDRFWTTKTVDFDSKGPIAFWDAVDRLGVAGGFRLDSTGSWSGYRTEPTIRLVRSDTQSPIKASYVGPYRIELISLDRHRQTTQTRPGKGPNLVDEFSATLNLVAEPGLVIDYNGTPKVVEALDEAATDLRPVSSFDPSTGYRSPFRQWWPQLGVLTFKVPLNLPKARGGRLKRFQGDLPISVVARTGPILSVPLAGAEGRPFMAGGITLIVQKVDRPGGTSTAFQISIRGETARYNPAIAAGPRQLMLGPIAPGFHPDDHIQILDAQGRALSITSNPTPPKPDGTYEFRIQLYGTSPRTIPTTLRYYGLVGEVTEVPFEFADVPMP